MSCLALIVAAGKGSRFQSQRSETNRPAFSSAEAIPKQYHPLAQIPMVAHSLRTFQAIKTIDQIHLVVHPDDHRDQAMIAPYLDPQGSKVQIHRCGGETRTQSVGKGIQAIHQQHPLGDEDWLLVHDAARPCVRAEDVVRLIETIMPHPFGGILATPIADTIKRADGQGAIAATLDRKDLWAAQTPQMFRAPTLIQALSWAGGQTFSQEITDEAMAMEFWLKSQGLAQPSLLLVEGARDNIKITYAEDLILAESILKSRSSSF